MLSGIKVIITSIRMLSYGLGTGLQSFLPLVYCPVDDYVVRSQPRNPLFRCVKSLHVFMETTQLSQF